MPNYPRKAGTINLVAGIILILLALAGTISVSKSNISGSIIVIFLFFFMGGYEIGKYAENRQSKSK